MRDVAEPQRHELAVLRPRRRSGEDRSDRVGERDELVVRRHLVLLDVARERVLEGGEAQQVAHLMKDERVRVPLPRRDFGGAGRWQRVPEEFLNLEAVERKSRVRFAAVRIVARANLVDRADLENLRSTELANLFLSKVQGLDQVVVD